MRYCLPVWSQQRELVPRGRLVGPHEGTFYLSGVIGLLKVILFQLTVGP